MITGNTFGGKGGFIKWSNTVSRIESSAQGTLSLGDPSQGNASLEPLVTTDSEVIGVGFCDLLRLALRVRS